MSGHSYSFYRFSVELFDILSHVADLIPSRLCLRALVTTQLSLQDKKPPPDLPHFPKDLKSPRMTTQRSTFHLIVKVIQPSGAPGWESLMGPLKKIDPRIENCYQYEHFNHWLRVLLCAVSNRQGTRHHGL